MYNFFFTILLSIIVTVCTGQTLVSNRELINNSQKDLKSVFGTFNYCILNSNVEDCIKTLTKSADDEYKKYLIGGLLYQIDSTESFKLHQEAYLLNKQDQNFILEYAIELHRKGQYNDASKLYESYVSNVPKDIRIYAWLADCYINIGDIERAIENWNKANFTKNHTSIDKAIYTIYGSPTQLKNRNKYKSEIEKGDISMIYPLIFLDINWEFDWWNTYTQEFLLKADIEFIKKKIGISSSDFQILKAYIDIKKIDQNEGNKDEIKKILIENKIIIDNNPFPENGKIASNLLRICFSKQILLENDFYRKRGDELLNLAKTTKDKEILNIYAYLQVSADGKVKPEIDKLGWMEFKDERFAISYFIGKADKNKFDDPELSEALRHFPNSSKLYQIKAKCAIFETKEAKTYLIELIKKDFKTLNSDQSRFCYGINSYFAELQTMK